jgi:hypothetical protein
LAKIHQAVVNALADMALEQRLKQKLTELGFPLRI